MKKMRLPLILVCALAVLGIILGCFFDLSISQAIASSTNGFGLTVSVISPTIAFTCVCIFVGGLIALGVQKERKLWLRIIFFIVAIAVFAGSVYLAGAEYFGRNGFYQAAPSFLGQLIAAIPLAGGAVLGFFLFKDNKNPYAWVIIAIFLIVVALLLVGPALSMKNIMHRPRYRAIAATGVEFHAWWQPCKNYKELMETYNLAKEEFSSSPSGHTAMASFTLVTATFLPFVCPKLRKAQIPLFIGATAFCLLLAFSRILAAAHFLTDVSSGLLISALLTLIANEIVIHVKPFHQDEAKLEESK